MNIARILFLMVLLPKLAFCFELRGMHNPEGFIVDPSTGIYYISNINGDPKAKDNNGYIAKVDPAGNLLDKKFIKGGKNQVELNAPKGLAISGEELFVADIDVVRYFDKNTGLLLGTIDLKLIGAISLSDLTADLNGNIYASDTSGDIIFKIDTKKSFQPTIVAKGSLLENPKGMVYDPIFKRLVVTTWGTGRVLTVDMNGKIMFLFLGNKQFKKLNGIEFDKEGNLLVSDFKDGKIYRIRNYSTVEVIRENLLTPADISFDYKNNQILIPSFEGNLVFTHPLN